MIITITAVLTEDEINILANQKFYQDTTLVQVEKEVPHDAYSMNGTDYPAGTHIETITESIQNPQSKADFIRQVYEGIINADASTEIIKYINKQKEAIRIAEENAIREKVASSITSTVE